MQTEGKYLITQRLAQMSERATQLILKGRVWTADIPVFDQFHQILLKTYIENTYRKTLTNNPGYEK